MEDSAWQHCSPTAKPYKLLNLLDIYYSQVPKVLALSVHGPDRAFTCLHFSRG